MNPTAGNGAGLGIVPQTVTTMPELLNLAGASVALVGATDTPWKYGHKILRNLRSKGITVYPVNNHRAVVDGTTAYSTLSQLPEQPTIVNVVVPPGEGPSIVRQVADLGWDNVWFQPGAESSEARNTAESLGVRILDGACTMVVARHR